MIQFTQPKNLNGIQLVSELEAAGVKVFDYPEIDGNGNFRLAVSEADKELTETIVNAHNGITITPELSVTEKLASVGLSINDLKIALGL